MTPEERKEMYDKFWAAMKRHNEACESLNRASRAFAAAWKESESRATRGQRMNR